MAFPTLFPFGNGDPTLRDGAVSMTLDQYGKHLVKYAVNLKKCKQMLLHLEQEK
jgi:hypothetical protein